MIVMCSRRFAMGAQERSGNCFRFNWVAHPWCNRAHGIDGEWEWDDVGRVGGMRSAPDSVKACTTVR